MNNRLLTISVSSASVTLAYRGCARRTCTRQPASAQRDKLECSALRGLAGISFCSEAIAPLPLPAARSAPPWAVAAAASPPLLAPALGPRCRRTPSGWGRARRCMPPPARLNPVHRFASCCLGLADQAVSHLLGQHSNGRCMKGPSRLHRPAAMSKHLQVPALVAQLARRRQHRDGALRQAEWLWPRCHCAQVLQHLCPMERRQSVSCSPLHTWAEQMISTLWPAAGQAACTALSLFLDGAETGGSECTFRHLYSADQHCVVPAAHLRLHVGNVNVSNDADLDVLWLQLPHDRITHSVQRQCLDLLRVWVPESPAVFTEPQLSGALNADNTCQNARGSPHNHSRTIRKQPVIPEVLNLKVRAYLSGPSMADMTRSAEARSRLFGSAR